MKLLKIASKRQTLLSEILYITLNVALVAVSLGTIIATEQPYLAIALVFLSKWRIFAVRPRFWIANLQSNLVDIIAGMGFVTSMWLSHGLVLQILIGLLYVAWLLLIKPQSKLPYPRIQAGVALFIGINTLLAVGYGLPAGVTVLVAWLIGFATARHVLSHHDEPRLAFYSLIWGFIVAELAWAFYHWTIAYSIDIFAGLAVAQGAIIILLFGFSAVRIYVSYHHNDGKLVSRDIMPPVAFSLALSFVLLIFFNNIPTPLG